MYLDVYVDVIFIVNFIMDFILLTVIKKILRYTGSPLRSCLGAAAGAMGACVFAVIPYLNHFIQFLTAYILLSCLLVKISFGKRSLKEFLKAVGLLYITTFFLGGLLNSLYYYTGFGYYFRELIQGRLLSKHGYQYFYLAVLAGTIGLIIFISLLKRLRYKETDYYRTELFLNERTVKAVGFMDTGNCLKDPYFGKPVIVAEYTVIEPLLTDSQNYMLRNLFDDFSNCTSLPCNKEVKVQPDEYLPLRMIPFQSVGRKGILPAIVLDKIILWEGKEETVREKVLTAISREDVSVRKDYQIILHREVM